MSGDEWAQWIERLPPLARITPATLAESMEGFRLGAPTAGFDWLARAIQGALMFTVPVIQDGKSEDGECMVITIPNATEQKRIYAELARLSDDLLVGLIRNRELLVFSLLDTGQYAALHRQVEALAMLFTDATSSTPKLPPRWRQKRAHADRVERATVLSPVFEMAYGRQPTINSYPGSDGGPWPDFYQRIVSLAFGEHATPDLEGVLDKARKSDKLARVTFAPGQIPEYPR